MDSETKAVLVTTEYRGVFFGYIPSNAKVSSDARITLASARNCIYWSQDVKGFLGLASIGPSDNCKIGPAVPKLELFKITSITDVTPDAVSAWEKSVWK